MTRKSLFARMFLDAFRGIAPAKYQPRPAEWSNDAITGACLGHSTVLLNVFGSWIITDPVFSRRAGLRLGPLILGPKRYLKPAVALADLPPLDLILLSHAHFDHFDLASLRHFSRETPVVTARGTSDLLRRFRNVRELAWGETAGIGEIGVRAIEVKHWGARMLRDDYRGYNGYVFEKRGRRICYTGDTAMTDALARLNDPQRPIDLIIMPIGAYDPWIRAHCSPEQAHAMATAAGAKYFVPVHHQTFQLSAEPMEEPGQRIRAAFAREPEKLLAVEVGETFVVPA